MSPEFTLYLIKEFQKLKELEQQTTYSLERQAKRSFSTTNYEIHTNAIKKQLGKLKLPKFKQQIV
ncbi:hypothetical protein SPONL_916 [uncultured Candidatus Thioglobus sp.]|nr:MAG: hypothetical protein A6F72_02325 [Cycloclasticus sp. symbiont of Poecilosclerida sp. N]SMN02258.1 hypothetical protein SPONL_916 [uncultured Candidatus Thioglobus sp.]